MRLRRSPQNDLVGKFGFGKEPNLPTEISFFVAAQFIIKGQVKGQVGYPTLFR
jgi:hypothetical protein